MFSSTFWRLNDGKLIVPGTELPSRVPLSVTICVNESFKVADGLAIFRTALAHLRLQELMFRRNQDGLALRLPCSVHGQLDFISK